MLHAVIMAGGAGTRFWPASRTALPKQLLDLAGRRTMLQGTIDRLGRLVPADRVLVVTNRNLTDAVIEQLPELPRRAVLGEPCKRDTAPCIALAAALLLSSDPDAIMAVMPADQVIRQESRFQAAIALAADLVGQDDQRIVTFGIRPTYPAESFGYLERGEAVGESRQTSCDQSDLPVFRVSRFREKPSAEVARQYIETGNFYWNSGIFVWRAATILDAIRRFEPDMHQHIAAIAAAAGSERFDETFEREFTAIRGKSIDFAVLEHYENVVVVEAAFDWDDLGSWRSLERLYGADESGNTVIGRHLGIRTSGSIVRSSDRHLVATLGMTDCIIVHTEDATLVANKNDEEAIRQLVQLIKEQGWEQYL
jgi:mannose-1-phosphate guanylyltransferase